MSEQEGSSGKDAIAMQRETRRWERIQDKAEKTKDNFKKEISNMFKQAQVKQVIAREALEAKRGGKVHDLYRQVENGGERGSYCDDGEIITGREEAIQRLLGDKYHPEE